jgi:DNA-binding transcriptional LysR family regulator
MELRHLTSFRAVAHASSFTRAAAQLGYVQSAVTAHVKALEAELGVRLFDRLSGGIALTEPGCSLLEYAERILDLTEEAAAKVGTPSEPAGPVTVSAPETLCAHRLPQVVRELHRHHPKVRILFRANPTGALHPRLSHALAHGEIDLAFVLAERLEPIGTLAVEPLTDEPLVVVASPAHPLAAAASVEPKDLDRVPLLLTEQGCPYRTVLERALAEAGASPEVAGEFTSSDTVKRCAEAGGALGVLAMVSVAAELTAGSLVALPWAGPPLRVGSYLVWNTARWPSPAIEAVLRVTRAVFHPTGAAKYAALSSSG